MMLVCIIYSLADSQWKLEVVLLGIPTCPLTLSESRILSISVTVLLVEGVTYICNIIAFHIHLWSWCPHLGEILDLLLLLKCFLFY